MEAEEKAKSLFYQRFKETMPRVKREAGIDREFRFHDLRHSVATKLLSGGVGVRTVQRMLGHSGVATTERYAHVMPEYLREASKVLDLPTTAPLIDTPVDTSFNALTPV